ILSSASRTGRSHRSVRRPATRVGRVGGTCSTTSTGTRTVAGRAGSSVSRASTPPADGPMTTALTGRGSDTSGRLQLLVDAVLTADIGKGGAMRGEAERLARADAQEAASAERLAKQADSAVLQRAVEVDEHVPPRHELHLGKDRVGGQAVIREDDPLAQ